MREIVDPDYDLDAVQEKIGSLPEDHSWQEVIEPSTKEVVRVPLPIKVETV